METSEESKMMHKELGGYFENEKGIQKGNTRSRHMHDLFVSLTSGEMYAEPEYDDRSENKFT